MKKYTIIILIAFLFLIGVSFTVNQASASGMSIKDFINLLITIGVITPDKLPAVNTFLASLNNGQISTSSATTTTTIQAQIAGTLCNGTYWSECPVGQNFICPQTGGAYCKTPQQPISVTDSTEANSSEDSGSATIYTDLRNPSSEASGIVKMIPVLIFDIEGQDDTLHLHRLTVHFSVNGTAQITTAYLYQGNDTPVSSASVSGNTATFLIPNNTTGASFGANIPSQFTIKVDTTGTNLKYSKDDSPFSISTSIDSSDMQLYNSSNNAVPITGSTRGNMKVTSGYCGPGCA